MKNLVPAFLSQADEAKIRATVAAVEKQTAGEVVPMVVSASYHYPMAAVIGGVALALPLALVLTPMVGGWFWLGHWNLWIFLVLLTVLFLLGHMLVNHAPGLKRFFISEQEIRAEVDEAAMVGFFDEGLYRTRDENGVLIFISLFEHRVRVLADRGVNQKIDQGCWDDVVAYIVNGIKNRQAAAAICEAVEMVGGHLATHFPPRPDDQDELQDLIVKS